MISFMAQDIACLSKLLHRSALDIGNIHLKGMISRLTFLVRVVGV